MHWMLLEIALAIVFSKIFNLVFEKLKQPGVIGEIIAGIILGPSLLGALSGVSLNLFGSSMFHFTLDLASPEFKEVAFIGAIFLLFIVGLETNTGDLKKVRKAGFFVGISSVFIPFLAGCLLGALFGMDVIQCMAIGAILNATSTTIAIRILSDMDMLSTRVGLTLHTAVVINDILAIIIFSLVFGTGNSLTLLLQILVFFAVTISIGFLLVRYAVHKNANRKAPIIILTSGLVICFLFAAVAENMGLTALIGAFIAGLFIRKTPQANILADYMKTIGYSFFIPLFFVSVGASFNLLFVLESSNLGFLLFFILIFVLFGIVSNFLGGSVGARISGLTRRESISIGFGMMPIMGVALISVTTGIDRGIFGASNGLLANQIRTATLLLIIISALITPPLLKKSMVSPLHRIFGKTKTKLSLYNHPHCHECFSPLRLNADNNEWFCDTCQNFMEVYKKPSKQMRHENATADRHIKYIIGAGTILLCGYVIQSSVTMTLVEKITALIGIFLGTTLAFFTIRLLFSNKKTSGRVF
ncbi:MAG: cation:proton antiporter [Candidatus Thermoplasmatota archaeon]